MSGRRTWVYREGESGTVEAIEVDRRDWTPTGLGGHRSDAEVYSNLQTTEGFDVSSRTKLRGYLKASGQTHPSDYGPEWKAKKREEKRKFYAGEVDVSRGARKESLIRAYDSLHRSNRR